MCACCSLPTICHRCFDRTVGLSLLLVAMMLPASTRAEPIDRQVAEWVLLLGGSVRLQGEDLRIHDVKELPTDDFQVELVDLVGAGKERQRRPAVSAAVAKVLSDTSPRRLLHDLIGLRSLRRTASAQPIAFLSVPWL